MKINRLKALVVGILALLVTGIAAGIVYVTLIDVKHLRYPTQAELRGALPRTAAAELQARGVTLDTSLTCTDLAGWTKEKMRVTCAGKAGRKPVHVIASGEDATQDQYYTILVDGRPLLQNARCLGPDCKPQD